MYAPNTQHGHDPHSLAPPPAKRQKGNAVITRYPPPPGYVPPSSTQLPQQAWQNAGYPATPYAAPNGYQQYYPGYNQPQAAYPSYPPNANAWQQPYGYAPPQGYDAQAWQAAAHAPYPGYNQQYPQYPGYDQQYIYSANGSMTAPSTAQAVNTAAPGTQSDESFAKPALPSFTTQGSKQRTLSTTRSVTAESATSQEPEHVPAHEFDEVDFTREMSFAKDQEGFSEELSLGAITSYVAKPVKTALPSTFDETELQNLADIVRADEDEAISKYFVKAKITQTELSVRQSPEWDLMKDDMIFRTFPNISTAAFTSIAEIKADRNRQDPNPSSRYPPTYIPDGGIEPESDLRASREISSGARDAVKPEAIKEEASGADDEDEDDEAMDLASDSDSDAPTKEEEKVEPSIKGTSISAESNMKSRARSRSPARADGRKQRHGRDYRDSRNRSRDRRHPEDHPRFHSRYSPPHFRDDHSRDDFRRKSYDNQHYNRNSWQSQEQGPQYGPHHAPPPPPPRGSEHSSPWNAADGRGGFETHSDSPRSATSQRTLPAGEVDRPDDGNNAGGQPGSGKKRNHDQMDRANDQARRRQYDDVAPRRYRPKVDEAYSSRRYR